MYVLLIVWYRYHWMQSDTPTSSGASQLSSLCVVIIARDEEDHIATTLKSVLRNQTQIPFQIIVVDDYSTDKTIDEISALRDDRITVLELSDFEGRAQYGYAFKKAGIHYALEYTTAEYILMTDADCVVGPDWIDTMVGTLAGGEDVVTGPVKLTNRKGVLRRFQQIEMMGTMAGTLAGIASGSYHSANAANLLFRRDDYLRFLSSTEKHLATGDDVFFVQYMADLEAKIAFCKSKEAIVETATLANFSDFYQQRVRWASKTTAYSTFGLTGLMAFVFLFHLLMIVLPIYGMLSWQMLFIALGLTLYISKILADYYLLRETASFFSVGLSFFSLIAMVILHAVYVVCIGTVSLIAQQYQWKGRKISTR